MTNFPIKDLESLTFEWRCSSGATWEDCLIELTEYRKINGHCNVPKRYSANANLANWVGNQRTQYKLYLKEKASHMTTVRIQELESLGFEWNCLGSTLEDRLSELVVYRGIHGHCNVHYKYSENCKLAHWVTNQRSQYKLHLKGKTSHMTNFRIQALESLDFEWIGLCATSEDRLSELAEHRKIHGHCNVPTNYSENTKLGRWVATQRYQYKVHVEGKTSSMALTRIQNWKA